MGKSPMVYSGNERSRHYSYSRNNQSRNRRSQNQGIGPANYYYSPESYLRQLPPSRRGNRHVGRGSSQQYFRDRSFQKRQLSSNRGHPLRVQQRITPQRKRQRQNMHPPEELESASDVTKSENYSTSQSQAVEQVHSNETPQTSVPQTRSTTKSQQSKFEETGSAEKSIEDGDTKVQNLQTRSTSKAHGKSEELDKDEDGNSKITRSTRGSSNKSLQAKSDSTCTKELFEVEEINRKDEVSVSPTKSASMAQNKSAESSIHKVDDNDKVIHKTRGNKKSVNNEKDSGTTAEVQSVEEKTGGINTRLVAKTKQEANDKAEHLEETENVLKPKILGDDTKTASTNESVDTKSKLVQGTEIVVLVEIENVAHQRSYDHEGQLNKGVTHSVSQETTQSIDMTVTAEENGAAIEKEVTSRFPNTKKLIGSRSPKLVLSHVDTPMKKVKEFSFEKQETDTPIDTTDVTRRSSRRSSSKAKTEETLLLSKRQLRGRSGTPIQIQTEIEQQDHGDTSAASIRSISCRRPIRDSPISRLNDSFHKRRTLIAPQVQLTAKTTSEYLSDRKLDIAAEKNRDMSPASDVVSPPKEKPGDRRLSPSDDTSLPKEKPGKQKLPPLGDTSPTNEKTGKRKLSQLETNQEYKKLCTSKTAQSLSFFSDVSSPVQIIKKQELVSSSTPFKVVECFDDIHMEVSEENISEESVVEFEKTGDITDQSITLKRETHLIKENIVDESRVFEKTGDISGQSVAVENETHLAEHANEQTSRKWCSVM